MVSGEGVSFVGVFAGAHWGASIVQVMVAAVLAVLAIASRRRVAELARRIDAVERLAHWLSRLRPSAYTFPSTALTRSFTPLERFGRRHLQRPPPSLAIGC
jgi:hypothetical protein